MEMSMKSCKSMSKLLRWEYGLFVTGDEDAPGPVYVLGRRL